MRRYAYEAELAETLAAPEERLRAWEVQSEQLAADLAEHRSAQRIRGIDVVRGDTTRLIDSMHTQGDPLICVLAVLVGRNQR